MTRHKHKHGHKHKHKHVHNFFSATCNLKAQTQQSDTHLPGRFKDQKIKNTKPDNRHFNISDDGERVYGTSFTRNKQMSDPPKGSGAMFGAIALEINPSKIKHTNEVEPIDYQGGTRYEAEEFVIGDIPRCL